MSAPRSKLLGYIVIFLAVFSVAQGAYFTYESQQKTACQAQYNADFAVVVRQRAQWANEDKAAQLKLFRDLLGSRPGGGKQILEDYLTATARTDKLRAENPLPKLEDRDC